MNAFSKLFGLLLGRIAYTPPPWISAINNFRKRKPIVFWAIGFLLLAAGAAAGYYLSQPAPIQVAAQINPPGPPADVDDPAPDRLEIAFAYAFDDLDPDRPLPEGDPSVARIDRIDKPLDGIRMAPTLPGRWQWADDRTLIFEPERPWPAGTRFTVSFPPAIFSPETRLKSDSAEFETPAFEAAIESLEFYQDPTDSAVRRVVATVGFSHPVDPSNLESHLTMAMRPSDESIQTPPVARKMTVRYDEHRHQAYLSSEPIRLPPNPNIMRLTVAKGVMPASGGQPIAEDLTDTVLIPDRTSFLKVDQTDLRIVVNDRQEPEQVLTLAFTDEIDARELEKKLQLYLLPEFNSKRKNRYWKSPREVSAQVLAASQRLNVKALPNARPASTTYHFVLDVPEGRYLYLRIEPGLTSVNDFVQNSFYDNVMATPTYPRQVQMTGDGSLLALSGKRRLGMMARGLSALRISVGRLLPNQIVHLVTQTGGDIRDPYFSNRNFDAENIAETTRKILDLKPLHPKQANYASLDLSEFLREEDRGYGLFFVNVEGWDKKRNRRVHGAEDQRLILISDLGLLVKNNADGSHELFVQSIATGRPVAGAMVQLLGKNGLPLFRRTTSAEGLARIPVTRDFKGEQRPSVYLVKTETDTAFIPFGSHSRQVDFSRFEVGGLRGRQAKPGALTAFLFSDRGIYRPGETVHLGMIVKNAPLDNVTGIPMEAVIRDPRRNTVKTEKITLPEKGFFEVDYVTDATSNTGRYQVSLYLVRDNRNRGPLLGSTDFTVEEFIPDTMKIASTLLDVTDRGWTAAPSLTARVSLQNLFGAPAGDRRVQATIGVQPTRFRFDEFADYRFADPFADAAQRPLRIDEALEPAVTDADGQVRFTIPLDRFREGTYRLNLTVEGFDPGGGRSVSAQNWVLISPLPHLVGFKSDGDLDFIHAGGQRRIDWIAIDPALKPLALADLTVKRLEIQHLSTLVKQPNGTFKYQTVDREREIDSQPFAIAESGTGYPLPTQEPGDYAIEVHDPAGVRLARLNYTVVGHGNLTGRLEKEAALQLKLDRSDYRAGDTIEMSVTAPYTGTGLITIESDRVHAFKWFTAETTGTLASIRVPDGLEGNAYVCVSFVRDAGSKEIFTSPLSTAVAPFTIDRSRRQLEVSLEVDKRVRPGKAMTIGYATEKPSRVAVFAVDEGILQVAGYHTPKPIDHFMRKRALEVTTLQMLDLILPEYNLIREAMASGGGAMRKALAANLNPFARLTDTPAVFWSGIVDGGPDRRTVSFTVPDTFDGNLKVMAVAVGEDAIGTAEADTLVRGPFVLSPSVLLQTAPDDEFVATVGVANLVEGSGKQAAVDVRIEASDNLKILGEHTLRLTIDEEGEGRASFTVRAGQAPGAATLTFSAQLGDEEGRRTVGLSIRPAVPYGTTFVSGHEKDGSVRLTLPRQLFPQLAEQRVSASASPLVLVDALVAYLDHFPHGCTEQVVSQVFPLVGLLGHPGYRSRVTDIDQRFAAVIDRLRERQLAGGGFCFWPGGSVAADFPSVYVMHFLIESRELGYVVPADMLRRGTNYLQEAASRDVGDLTEAGVQAQAIYLLTRLGKTTTNYLVRLQETLQHRHPDAWETDLAAVYMAAAYQLLKMDAEADRLAGQYRIGADKLEKLNDFNWPLTRDAQALYLLCRHFEKRAAAIDGETVLKFIDPIFKGETNTIGASYAILALGAYGRLQSTDGQPETVRFEMETADGAKQALDGRSDPFPTATYGTDARKIGIDGTGPLFYLNVQSGFDHSLPTQPLRSGLEIYREYTDASGEAVETFTQGQEVTVHLRIRSLKSPLVTNVAIVDLLPGGFEVIRSSVQRTVGRWTADYVDVREDRVVFYGNVGTSVRDLTYRVKVVAAGSFSLPAAAAESMYDRSLKAATAGGRITVAPAP
ncbi:alpha-2-macroglobulin [Desulfosarcina widdelii]|uniref:Alpha-2-macroglobulin n=1 Tax=Desulfosarcina widdelii TaxID=947919 RepID=A0A5K7Z6T8_9BACT|nr:alpha-2-macroglobulin [Desulfosarcina widdelii]BBO75929.1 alpha-2-macroglobulin [Desulfosarcina widdelii]